jgi:hypothetical protein
MNERIMTRGFPWGEPAHPGIVKQFDDLTTIYKVIRSLFQDGIDRAFDRVSRDIGFVVSTTLPVTCEIIDGKTAQWTMAEPLKGSLFEGAMLDAMKRPQVDTAKGPIPDPWKGVSAGQYPLYLVWFDALKLKLRKDWLEPVHYLREDVIGMVSQAAARVRPEVQEPAHWFLPSVVLAADEKILISAIDEVYPELRLAERIANTRQALRGVRPEVMEPAHVRTPLVAELALREIGNIFKRVGPGIPEPAHHLRAERDILAEIEAVVRKFGM